MAKDWYDEHVIVIPVTFPPKKKACPKHEAHNGRYVHLCTECVALNAVRP